jgi:hypothetical protein
VTSRDRTCLHTCLAAVGAALICGSAAVAVATETRASVLPLAAHQAIYDLKLAQSHKMSLQSVRGRIVYEFTGSECAGFTTQVRQVTEMDNGEGSLSLSDLRSKTWEDAKSQHFKFESSNYVNERISVSVEGEAKRDAKGIEVVLRKPERKTFRLNADTVFPTEQLRHVIAAARAGKKIVELPVYDGSENGEKIYNTLTVIGDLIPQSTKPSDAAGQQAALSSVPRWHVRVSYFDQQRAGDKPSGEQTPAYAIAFEIYENGISRALTLDYNDFSVAGTMSTLDLKEPQACK